MGSSKLTFLSAMGVFGTIGIFVRYIPLPSGTIAFFRGVLGVAFLLAVMLLGKKKFDTAAIRRNLVLLCLSGAAIGVNWILLFESYRYTTVATATVCYYLAPLFLLLACPLLGERLTVKKVLCIAVALVGLVFVSGVMEGDLPAKKDLAGIGMGIGAALFYATVMFLNKKFTPIPAYDKTILQLSAASLVIAPYLLATGGFDLSGLTGGQWGLLLVVGIVHTGIAYTMYFGAMKDLSTHAIALFSYLDPVIAVVLSALVLRENIGFWGVAGTVLILGSALYSELDAAKSSR